MAYLTYFETGQDEDALRELLTAYLEEGSVALAEAGLAEDIPAIVADDLANIDKFQPPSGRIVMLIADGAAAGCGAVRVIGSGVAEIKRMYLQPESRGKGFGKLMIHRLLDEARALGCLECRLDTGWFMSDAQRLYRAAGFTECEPYVESEVPAEFDRRWIYMRRDLTIP